MNTLDQLRRAFDTPTPTITQVREKFFPDIQTDKHLLRLIRAGKVALPANKLREGRTAPYVVRLPDLAEFLDARAGDNQAPPDAAPDAAA
ncbi:pyocin activator PrtN family protein [Pseudomonas oryzihabitans]|uniref:pyocin activator PrtN family protein n=1 Tax=Pseudomonas oryzihabitans TaxID=47885 RepID=UPI0028938567|nr:pyocin activator PrtN family protein [Pseudomonas oryzihabitans]MDT3720324.1 pyocin activator PrtN family protein [Pseudomonas oryzihabitans]